MKKRNREKGNEVSSSREKVIKGEKGGNRANISSVISNRCIQSALGFHGGKSVMRDSVESRKERIPNCKRDKTPIYHSFAARNTSSVSVNKSLHKSKDKLNSTLKIKIKRIDKPITVKKLFADFEDDSPLLHIPHKSHPLEEIGRQIRQFAAIEPEGEDFDSFIHAVGELNERVKGLLITVRSSKEKETILEYSSLVDSIGKKYILRAEDRH